ncbi:methyl-accepting chemotaxis protein [Archangium lansingense]|uniref:Methyl-accepting chemotaxis protein n=1 Tax=Archangium lansingense TaxID=2995310 RepID=A0ABT4ANM8_9BACT|nr:methyl-accepting chemotaxis protein [Archangium lansinium]MCY1083294.1 methyl-accepting chemotaxis protein [Archangium lansinium]
MAEHMDNNPPSPDTEESYHEFLLKRGPLRLGKLTLTALVASPVLFVLDMLYALAATDAGLDVTRVALARLPWLLVPAALLAVRKVVDPRDLPVAMYWTTLLYAVGNDWAFYRMGLEGSGYHVVMVFLNVLTGPSMLPVRRWARMAFYALLGVSHLGFDLALSRAPVAGMLVLDLILLLGSLAVGLLLEALHSGHRKQFHLRQSMQQALRELEASRGKVVETGRTLAGSAQVLSSTIADMSQQAVHVRTAALRIATASEQMASAAGALFRHSRASATQAEEAQRYTGEVDSLVSGMETSLSAIGQAVVRSATSVQRLEESSERIHGFVETIQEMAAATNMLALNAGIEAARAGEHGRGFAVVAKEVGKLAEESGRSSARIGEVVGGVTKQMSETLSAVGHIRETTERFTPVLESARTTLRSIREIVLQNQKLMEKSAGEAERQAEQTTHISQGCATLLELVDTYAQMGTDVAATALKLGNMADELRKLLPEAEPAAKS